MSKLIYFFLSQFIFSIFSNLVSCNDVLGCGGYVQSEVTVDFSQVQIRLLTQQGNLKYETECAPNNGYYFIPLYDKGDYILKVYPPEGWSFEPEEVHLKVDGEKDPCSLNKDINFRFKGFAVVGRVVTIGSEIGPPGITVDLKQGDKRILRTVTTENGDYLFTPLAAGTYDVVASHPTWTLVKNKVTVTVSDKNGNAGNSLVVGGYFLSGSVDLHGKIANKLRFVLHSSKKFTHKLECHKDELPSYQNKVRLPVVCHAIPNENGHFQFSNIPLGKYVIVPHLVSPDVDFIIEPSSVEVEMGHEDNRISEVFKVSGRSVHGRVLMGKDAAGISGAQVTLNRSFQTKTDDDGNFVFHNVKFGEVLIQASAVDGVEFEDLKLSVNMKTGFTTLVPVRYQTCFSVTVDSASDTIPWFITIIGENSRHETQTGSSGSGCIFLKSGKYRAFVSLTTQDEEAGIRFGPSEHIFTIESQPILNLSFSQFLGEIAGTIHCLESCRSLIVSLRPSKGSSGSPRTTTASQGKFTFSEVVPGDYLLSVDKEEWCWKEQTVSVSVNAKVVSAKFEQTGFRLTLNASHRVTLSYVTNKGHAGTLDVTEGTSRQCVSAPGKYVFTPTGCHKFGNAPLTWDTSSLQLLSLIASHHEATGTLVSNESGPFSITVKSETNQEYVISALQLFPNEKYVYGFELFMESGETVTLVPSSSSNLFQYSPPSFTFTMTNDCMTNVVEFKAERALFLKGLVKPALKGVTIKVTRVGEELTFTTNADGVFIAGPLDKSQDYTVSAEKIGYVIKPPSQKVEMELQKSSEVIKMSFEACKLAEIIVRVVDDTGKPLEGVLVSTSGGKNYRQNSLTESDGTFAFQSLMPSDYFLRPMMKEYKFDPPSKMVKVEVGATVNVSISGVRVAYSVFGQTLSLSGEPEAEVMIEAVGIGEKCLNLQEEALSDSQGNFRIRGLTPLCEYRVQLKKGEGVNQHVERSLPREKVVQIESSDHRGIKVIVIRPFLQMDVAIMVDTDRQYLPYLTAELYRDDSHDSNPAHVVALGHHPFFMLPPMIMDYKPYSIHLMSSLPHTRYAYNSPSVSFVANSSFISLSMSFKPTLKSMDAEISRGTVFGLFLFVFMVSIVLNYNKIQPLALKAIEMYQAHANNRGNGKAAKVSPPPQQIPIDTSFIEPVLVKKRVKVRKT